MHSLDTHVAELLDSALVGSPARAEPEKQAQVNRERDQDIDTFTQQRSQGTPGGTFKPGYHEQSEVGCVVLRHAQEWSLITFRSLIL